MAGPRGLGRGLDALIRSTSVEAADHDNRRIPLDRIKANPEQPRSAFPEEGLAELAESIKSQGVLQPILVRPAPGSTEGEYEIVAGERRWRAAKLAGLTEIPAVIRDLTDEQALAIALIENLQRENLNPMDEAKALANLRDMLGINQEELAKRVGKSRSHVANTMRLLGLPEEVRAELASGAISAGHARAILVLSDDGPRRELCRRILSAAMSVRQAEDLANYHKDNGQFPEPAALPAAPKERKRREAAEKLVDDRLKDVLERLRELLGPSVNVKGILERGRIVIPFKGEEALRRILETIEGTKP